MRLANNFKKNLQALRRKKALTQQSLAEQAGISVAYVSLLERGLRMPPLDTVDQLAKALRVQPLALLQ